MSRLVRVLRQDRKPEEPSNSLRQSTYSRSTRPRTKQYKGQNIHTDLLALPGGKEPSVAANLIGTRFERGDADTDYFRVVTDQIIGVFVLAAGSAGRGTERVGPGWGSADWAVVREGG